jgi:hypothetical protein
MPAAQGLLSLSDAELLGDEVMKVRIQLWCRDIWTELEQMGG